MASEVDIQKSLVTQAPQDAIGILKKEKEAKNDLVVEEGNNEDTDGECFLYPPSVGKVATEAHLESGLAEHEEIAISDSSTNNQQMDAKNAESGESEAESEHVKKENEEKNANVSNHNNLLEVQAVEVPICVPSQTSETFEKDKKSESNAEIAVPLDPMTLLGKVEVPITEGEYSLVQCSAVVAGSEETEQSEKKLIGRNGESSVDGASVVSQTASSSVESGKEELASQNEKEVREAIQPPVSTNVEEKLCLQQVGKDVQSEEESSHLFEEFGQEKTATNEELKDELTVGNMNSKSNDEQDMGTDESANGETQILSSKIDTEVTSEETLKENSYELVSNDQESLQTEEQHLELVPACSEKEISSELIKTEECIEKQAIKQMETEKKCEEETLTMISEDISAVEITKETTAIKEGEMELFVADSEIQEKEVDNFNTSGVPEDNILENNAKEMNRPENIPKNENDFSLGHNEVVESVEKEAESQEKQETKDSFEEETHNSNASEQRKTTQPAVLEGSLVEAATEKDLYSATSILGEKSEEIRISGEEKRLEDDNDESRNLPMEKAQDKSTFSEEKNTHEVTKLITPDSNARGLNGSHLDEKPEGKFEDSDQQETADDCVSEVRLDAAEDNTEGERSVEETANPERSTSPPEGPPLEKPEEIVSVQADERIDDICTPIKTIENDLNTPEKIDDKINPEAQAFDMRDQADHDVHNSGESSEQMTVNRADGASSNFDEVTNEENDNETPNTTKEEIADSLSKEDSAVKEITEEASDRHNTSQESTEKVEAKIYQAKDISNIQKKTSEEDNASGNQIIDAENENTETTYTPCIVVEEKDRDGAENGTTSKGSEEKESTFEKNVYYVESSMQPDFSMENDTQKSIEKIEVVKTDDDHTISTAQQKEKSENGNDLGEVNEGVSNGEDILSKEGVSHSSAHTTSVTQASETSLECSETVELKDECSTNVPSGQKESASSNEENDVVVTGENEKVYNLDEIIDKDMVTAAGYTAEESVDKHTEDEERNMVQETDRKTEDVPRENPTDNIPQDFGQVSPTELDTSATEGRTNIDENPLTESHRKDSQLELDDQPTSTDNFSPTASGGTEKERTNQEDRLNESTMEVDIEDNFSASSNVKGKGCPPVGTDKPEAVEDDDIINERSGNADSEGEQKQAPSIDVEAIGGAIDAEDSISKQDDGTNISNDGLQILKGKGEASDGDNYYQENDSPINDEVCTKENTEPADAVEKSESCSASATASKSSTSVEPNKLGTDESQAVEHEDDEPVMNSHLEEHGSITESEAEVELKGSANIEEVGQKAREVDLAETQVIEREVEEDVPHFRAKKADDKNKYETVKEDSSRHCDERNTTESDKNEHPKDGQEKEKVGFDDIHGTNVVEDAEIGTYRSEENINEKEMKETVEKSIHQAESFSTLDDSLQVFEVQDKELENIKEENSNSILDVVSTKEIPESVVIIDKNDHQTNLEADNNIPSVEANECASDEAIRVMKYQDSDPSDYLSQEVHKEQGLSVTEVVTEIKDDESANGKGNENKTASAIELDEETSSITKMTEENFQQVIIEESVDTEYGESTAAEVENLVPINDDHTKISNVENETSETSNVEEESTLAQKHDNPDNRVDNAISQAISAKEIIDAVEVEKLECGPECNNLTDSNKDETDANCAENVVMDECEEEKTLSAEMPEINFAKCSLEKVEDETQLTDELKADEKSQVSERRTKEEDFQQATEEERIEMEMENERETCMSDNKHVHEGEKMSELHKSTEMGAPHLEGDGNVAEESLVPNDSSVEIQNQQIFAVVDQATSGENLSSLDFPASNLDIPEEGIKENEKRVDYGETADKNEIVKADDDNHSSVGYRATVDAETSKESEYYDILKEVTGKEEMPTADSGEEVKKTETSSKADNLSETDEERTPLEVCHSSEDVRASEFDVIDAKTEEGQQGTYCEEVKKTETSPEDDSLCQTAKEYIPLEVCHSSEDGGAFEFDVTDDKTEAGQQGTHCIDVTNKMETVTEAKKNNLSEEPGVSNEVATHEGCSALQTTQLSEVTQSAEDTMASKLEIPLLGITKEKLGNVSSEAALDTGSDMKDDLSDELGASTGDKMSEECVPIDENCGGTGSETETVTTEVKETSPNSGSSVIEKVSKGCEPVQESLLPENTLKEGIEKQKQGEINGEIACKPEIMKVEFEDDLPEKTSAKTEEFSHLEESQSPEDVSVSTFNIPTEVKDNLARESGGSIPPNVSTECLDSEECHSSKDALASKFDILNENIAYGQKQEEISDETAFKTETVNAETKDDLPEEPGTSVEKMTREAIEDQQEVVLDETESKTKTVNVAIKVDASEDPDSLSIEKASEGVPSQEHQSPNDVLDFDLDVPKEGDQEVKENDFDEAACEAETVQAQVNNDSLKEGASDVKVKVDLPGEPDSLSAAKTSEEGAPLGKDESNSVESSGFDILEEGDKRKGDDSHLTACGMETVHPQVNSDLLEESGASDVAIKVVLPEEQDSLSVVKISEESVPSGQSQSSEHVPTSTFDIPREGETEKKEDDSIDISCGVATLHAQVSDDLRKEPDVSNDADAAKMSEKCAPLEENQSSKDIPDSEFNVPEEDTREEEKQGEVCSEIAYKTNIVDVGNKGDLSEETSTTVNEETNSQEGQPEGNTTKVLVVGTTKADENVKEKTSEEQLEQSSSWKIEHEQEDEDTEENEVNAQSLKEERPVDSYVEKHIAHEIEREVDDSNVDSEPSMDLKQVQELEIPGITDKSSMGEPGESPSEFKGGNQPSNNSESIIKSLKQQITTETELQFSSKSEETDIVTPQTDATSENQEQNESSEQKSGLYDQELIKSEENIGEKQCKEETNELIAKENQSEMEREKYEATTCDTNNEKNIEPAGTLEKQDDSSEASDSSHEKNTALSDANWEEIAQTSSEDKAIETPQTAKELKGNDEFPGGELTQEDFEQAEREITGYKVDSVDAKDKTIPSKLDVVEVQKDIKEHEGTGCNQIDEPRSVKDKETVNPGSDDGSNIDKLNQEAGIGVEATELHLDSDKNIQNHDDSVEVSNDTVEVVQVQERDGNGAEYHINNVSEEEVKSVGKPYEAETFYTEEKCTSQKDHNGPDVKTPEEWAPQQEGDFEDVITQEVDVSIEKLQEKQQILEKEEPREQENIQKAINVCSTAENEEEISASDIIAREINVSSAANDGTLYHPKVVEDENLAARDESADHSAQNLMVDGIDGEGKSPKSTPDMSSQEPEELSAADIIANQISLDIEREEQKQQLSSQRLQEHEAIVVGSNTLDMDNHAPEGNTMAISLDGTTRMSCLPKDGQTELGVPDSECGLEQTDPEENQKTMSSELVAEPENKTTTEADKATTCDAEKHEDVSQASSREETKAQSQTENRQNTEKSPEDNEKQHISTNANEIPEEKVLCHDAEAAPQDSQNESPESSENAATAGEQAKDNEVNLSSVVNQMDEEAMNIYIIPHLPKFQEQLLEKKEVTIESLDNSENAVTAGEQDRGAEVVLSAIASQNDEESTKSCIIPHIPEVQEQTLDEEGLRMEDNKDKDLHENRQMEDTKNNNDDTVQRRPIVEEEKLLENHGSTHEKGQMKTDTSISVSAEQDLIGSCPTESHGDEVVSHVPQNAVKEIIPMAGAEKSSIGEYKIEEKGCLEQKGEQTSEIKTGSILAVSTKTSSSDIMQRTGAQTCQTDKEKHIIPKEKTPDREDVAAEELQTDEEKDEEGDVDKAPFITEAMRDFDIKASNKKSHNILSGVGSKVKHSISKVKKAITCSSSQFASDDVIVKLNKNKKS